MAKRYYLADIIEGPMGPGDYAHAAWVHGVNASAWYPPQNPDGTYSANRCLVIVGTADHRPLLQDNRLTALPDVGGLDLQLSAIRTQTVRSMEDALPRWGLVKDWQSSVAYRDVIRSLGNQLRTGFDENRLDVVG